MVFVSRVLIRCRETTPRPRGLSISREEKGNTSLTLDLSLTCPACPAMSELVAVGLLIVNMLPARQVRVPCVCPGRSEDVPLSALQLPERLRSPLSQHRGVLAAAQL